MIVWHWLSAVLRNPCWAAQRPAWCKQIRELTTLIKPLCCCVLIHHTCVLNGSNMFQLDVGSRWWELVFIVFFNPGSASEKKKISEKIFHLVILNASGESRWNHGGPQETLLDSRAQILLLLVHMNQHYHHNILSSSKQLLNAWTIKTRCNKVVTNSFFFCQLSATRISHSKMNTMMIELAHLSSSQPFMTTNGRQASQRELPLWNSAAGRSHAPASCRRDRPCLIIGAHSWQSSANSMCTWVTHTGAVCRRLQDDTECN